MDSLADLKVRIIEIRSLIDLYDMLFSNETSTAMKLDLVDISSRLDQLTTKDESKIGELALEVEKIVRVYELSMISFMRQNIRKAMPTPPKKEMLPSRTMGFSIKKLLNKQDSSGERLNQNPMMEKMLKDLEGHETLLTSDEKYSIQIAAMKELIKSIAKCLQIAVPAGDIISSVNAMAMAAEKPVLKSSRRRKSPSSSLMPINSPNQVTETVSLCSINPPESEQLLEKIAERNRLSEKCEKLKQQVLDMTEAKTDPSIQYQKEQLETSLSMILEISTLHERLKFEQYLIECYEKKLFEPAAFETIDSAMKSKIIQWVDQFPLPSGGWPYFSTWGKKLPPSQTSEEERTTAQRLKLLVQKAKELQFKAKDNILSDQILGTEKHYLRILLERNPCMQENIRLIEARLLELAQFHDPMAMSTASDQENLRNLPRLKQEIMQLRNGIDLVMQGSRNYLNRFPDEDNDPVIANYIQRHKQLSLSIQQCLDERDSRVSLYTQAQAFKFVPLEYDQLIQQMEPNQQCLEKMTSLKRQMDENASELQKLLDTRQKNIDRAKKEIFDGIEMVKKDLIKIKGMRDEPILQPIFQMISSEEITQWLSSLDLIENKVSFMSENKLPMSDAGVLQKKSEILMSLADLMVTIKLKTENIKRDLKFKIQELSADTIGCLLNMGQTVFFSNNRLAYLERLNDKLQELKSQLDIGIGILDKIQYARLLEIDEKMHQELEAFKKIKKDRCDSDLSQVIEQMKRTIDKTLQDPSLDKTIKPILEAMHHDLEVKKSAYLNLHINEKTLIEDSLLIVKNAVSKENLDRLSEPQLNYFMLWIRHLVEPLMQYINKIRHISYGWSLFASPAEKEVADTAQNLHQTLSDQLIRLDDPEFASREASMLDAIEVVEPKEIDSTSSSVTLVHS